jgi:hypothetical protein
MVRIGGCGRRFQQEGIKMSETAKLEYRVRTAPRYYVTRYHADAEGTSGVETKGVYDSIEVACEVAYALCKAEHDKLGFAPGDDRIVYPEMHPQGIPAMNDLNGTAKPEVDTREPVMDYLTSSSGKMG